MIDNFDLSLVNWSRAQFALTAMYHWLFVPLTLGLSFILAFLETLYVRTGNLEWKRITKFWMKLFGINFAIGVATGIILEFEFGTNWSNYSWFVGDIFGAPLAIEGIMAFFLESTFIAVMFFGWDKVSKKFHLLSTWLVAIGANLSALWILVANAWMQNPVGMRFNPETARNEMLNFWEVFLSPVAVNKFLHTISSGFVLASVFVIGISAWFLLKKREILFAKKSIIVAAVFGIIASLFNVTTGDGSARIVAEVQPMKFAAFEALYDGRKNAGLIAFGVVGEEDKAEMNNQKVVKYKVEIPNLLSYMAFLDPNAFVPGINDLINGNAENNIISAQEKIDRGRYAREVLKRFKNARKNKDIEKSDSIAALFINQEFLDQYFQYFGYGFLKDTDSLIPNIPTVFYSFHLMVGLGFYFILFFIIILLLSFKNNLEDRKGLLRLAVFTIPLPYLATMLGWTVAEVGRQPWVIQDLLPTIAAVSQINTEAVQLTFWLFAILFTGLLIAEISIMVKQIKIGPKEGDK